MKIFFDTETTGLPNWKFPEKDTPRMVQLGVIMTEDDGTIRRTLGVIFKSEGYSIGKDVSDIHGITDEIANAYGVSRENEFFWMLSDMFHNANEVIAHNYSFDKIILNGEFLREGIGRLDDSKAFCTKDAGVNVCKIPFEYGGKYGRANTQAYKWPKLSELYKHLFNEEIIGAHDALDDVRATMRCYFEMKRLSDLVAESKPQSLKGNSNIESNSNKAPDKTPIILSDAFAKQIQSTL